MVIDPSWLTKIHQGKQLDDNFGPYLEKAKSSDSEFVMQQVHGVSLLYHRPKPEVYQLVIPDGQILCRLLLEEAHCTPLAGHMGTHKVISALQYCVWRPRLTLDICTFICGCLVYQRAKDLTQLPTGSLQPLPIPDERFTTWTTDLLQDYLWIASLMLYLFASTSSQNQYDWYPVLLGGGELSAEEIA